MNMCCQGAEKDNDFEFPANAEHARNEASEEEQQQKYRAASPLENPQRSNMKLEPKEKRVNVQSNLDINFKSSPVEETLKVVEEPRTVRKNPHMSDILSSEYVHSAKQSTVQQNSPIQDHAFSRPVDEEVLD